MRRLTTRPDRAPVTGPAAWFIRFVGVDGVIGPLGFGGFTIPAIISVAQGRGIIYVWGNPTYGDGPFERIGVPTTVPLLVGFLAACLVQLVGAGLLIWLRPSGFIVMPAGMLLSAIFWWGFDLPLAWLGAGPDLAFLAAAWLVYTRASRKLVQRANRIPHCNQHETPARQPRPCLQPAPADLGAGDRPDPAPARGGTSMTAHPVSSILLDRDQVWQVIDTQRLGLAGLLDDLSEHEWQQPSLCDGWTVRDVAAHLTLQQLGARAAIAMMLRYRGDTDRAIRECARQRAAALSTGQIIAAIRAMTGSRRHNFGVTYRETLIDILVHAQDIAIPLGRRHPMPPEAAVAAVTRIWTMRWPPPFPASRTMHRFQVTATDTAWTAGPRDPAP